VSDIKVQASAQGYAQEQAQAGQGSQNGTPSHLETVADKDSQTIQEMIKESREKMERHREQLERIKTKPRYGDAPLEAYARLARAKNKSQVGMAAGYARRRMAQLRAALRTDSENTEEIKAALRQLEKAVSRAGKKKQDLQKEELKEARRERLIEEEERERAQRLNQELRRAKMLRFLRERSYMHEAVIDGQQQKMLSATRNELRQQAQALQGALGPSPEYAAQQYVAASAPEGAGGGEAAPAAPGVDMQV
jgi:hypothetical protein